MIKRTYAHKYHLDLLFFALLGAVTYFIPQVAFVVGIFAFVYGMFRTLKTRNRYGEAHLYAAFIVGAEVYFRMNYTPLPWEFAKLSVVILLMTGWFVEKRRKPFAFIYLLYLVLLIPGVLVPEWESLEAFKKEFMFTFFGEIVLVLSVFYFYRREMNHIEIVRLLRWMLLGIFLTSILLFLKTPNYTTIEYGTSVSFDASGGFGPNQVAAILGLGITILGYALLIGKTLFYRKIVDISMLMLFTLQGLFTFSRGGLMSAILSLLLGIIVLYLYNGHQAKRLLKISPLRIFVLIGLMFASYSIVDNITNGALDKRYLNVDEYGKQIKEDYSTKRIAIAEEDWHTFLRFPFTGAGVGGGRIFRERSTDISATHVEQTRILAEHGVLGIFVLMIMFFYPIWIFFKVRNALTRFTLTVFAAYAVLTMTHNALRLAMPSFLYGVAFIRLRVDKETEKRHTVKVG